MVMIFSSSARVSSYPTCTVVKSIGCFQRHLFVCVFVCLFVDTITSERVSVRWWNLGVDAQKYWPTSNLGVIAPWVCTPKNVVYGYFGKISASCLVLQRFLCHLHFHTLVTSLCFCAHWYIFAVHNSVRFTSYISLLPVIYQVKLLDSCRSEKSWKLWNLTLRFFRPRSWKALKNQ